MKRKSDSKVKKFFSLLWWQVIQILILDYLITKSKERHIFALSSKWKIPAHVHFLASNIYILKAVGPIMFDVPGSWDLKAQFKDLIWY